MVLIELMRHRFYIKRGVLEPEDENDYHENKKIYDNISNAVDMSAVMYDRSPSIPDPDFNYAENLVEYFGDKMCSIVKYKNEIDHVEGRVY